ncbi:hypothetical protein OGAPHI_006737 [Ogataea philodendri]|uniref:Uncharacterized protein n=1 Tax=Ogataea philodendri TaxID=1378263 RepID=A0A9P8NXI0_9ASCO|nr:uncharacterized protein OGAPHI_006737 [Ogataea philodendri]KAH3661330.1 hypothetical protein OGAPHI_006737 [Ogataea philodendri]
MHQNQLIDLHAANVLVSGNTGLSLCGSSVQGHPFRLVLEKSQSFHVFGSTQSKTVVDSSWKNQQIALSQFGTDPSVVVVSHVEKSFTVQNVPDLLVLVEMFPVENFQLGL